MYFVLYLCCMGKDVGIIIVLGMANGKGKMALAISDPVLVTSARCSGDQGLNASLYLDTCEVLTKVRFDVPQCPRYFDF